MDPILKWASPDGVFRRADAAFREQISPIHHTFTPASGRYHLYISLACPWAHRTLLLRNLKVRLNIAHCTILPILDHHKTLAKDYNLN